MPFRLPTGQKHGSRRRGSYFRPVRRPARLRTLGSVKVTHRTVGLADTATNVALGCALAAVLAVDTALTAAPPKRGNWVFELAVGLIVCAMALLRSRGRRWAAAAGLAVCALAGVAGDVYHLPSQPGVAATLGLLVLGAAAVRVASPRLAVVITAAGVLVMVAGRLDIRREYIAPLSFLGVLAWGCALAIGVWLRFGDARRHLDVDEARREERLELARELHDVVAHHVAGIVVQAQAARLVAARQPETLEGILAGIESAGNDALAAMRRVVSLLRDPGDAGGLASGPGQLTDLVDRFCEGHGPAVRLRLPRRRAAAVAARGRDHRLPDRARSPDQHRVARTRGGERLRRRR
jgi:signal transduction histidine kinase